MPLRCAAWVTPRPRARAGEAPRHQARRIPTRPQAPASVRWRRCALAHGVRQTDARCRVTPGCVRPVSYLGPGHGYLLRPALWSAAAASKVSATAAPTPAGETRLRLTRVDRLAQLSAVTAGPIVGWTRSAGADAYSRLRALQGRSHAESAGNADHLLWESTGALSFNRA